MTECASNIGFAGAAGAGQQQVLGFFNQSHINNDAIRTVASLYRSDNQCLWHEPSV